MLNISITYYRILQDEEGRKQYVAESLRSHPIVSNTFFWQRCLQSEIMVRYQQYYKHAGDEKTFEENYQTIKENVLETYCVILREYGINRNDFVNFIGYNNQKYKVGLGKEQLKRLTELFDITKVSDRILRKNHEKMQ